MDNICQCDDGFYQYHHICIKNFTLEAEIVCTGDSCFDAVSHTDQFSGKFVYLFIFTLFHYYYFLY